MNVVDAHLAQNVNVSHMTEELLSASEAARQLGIARKTLSRYIKNGLLKWHGENRLGSAAKGIRLSEARKVLASKPPDGRNVSRANMKPVVRRIYDELSVKLPGSPDLPFTPEEVVKTYVLAALYGELDVDFLLYCIERLHEGNQIFAAIAVGCEVPPLLCIGLLRWAAERLHKQSEDSRRRTQSDSHRRSFDGVDQTFDLWWRFLAAACLKAPAYIETAVVVGCKTKTATIELVPKWFRDVPKAMMVGEVLPVVGGHHSVVTLRRTKNTDRVNAIATRLAARAGFFENSVAPQERQVLLLDCLLKYQGEDVGHPDMKASPGFIAAAENAGISVDEAQLLLQEWSRISGDIAARGHTSFNDSVGRSSEAHAGFRLRTTVLSQILGVSRQTAASLKRKYQARIRR